MNKTSVQFVDNGNGGFEGLEVLDNSTNTKEIIKADGAFIFIGLVPNTKSFSGLVDLNERGFITTTGLAETSVNGILPPEIAEKVPLLRLPLLPEKGCWQVTGLKGI